MEYLQVKKLDIEHGNMLQIVLNNKQADELGIREGDKVHICINDTCFYPSVTTSDTLVKYGECGLSFNMWGKYSIPSTAKATVELIGKPKSIEVIKKKLLGGKLTYDEIYTVMKDIATRRLSTIEITYFAASSYSPGFDDEEVLYLTKAMSDTGTKLDFSYLGKKVVDKHSIGGVPSKGITPVLVSILACFDLVIPNTSSRAITSPAGTSDVLEVLMPVVLGKEEIEQTIKKTNACMVWGGGVDLAPADDVLIHIERPLHIESYDKFIVSIIAKKIATGLQYCLIDLPVGPGTKVEKEEDIQLVSKKFVDLGEKFGIKIIIYKRYSKGPDGYGIGPVLEARDLLYILERNPHRPKYIENTALDMAGKILEATGTVPVGHGFNRARSKLENKEALAKFWEIAQAQGAQKVLTSADVENMLQDDKKDIISQKSGKVNRINNKLIVELTRILGAPVVKHAGIDFHVMVGDSINRGDKVCTFYAASSERLSLAIKHLENVIASGDWLVSIT